MPSSCLLDELVAHRHHRSVDDSDCRHDRYSPCRVGVGHDCRCDCGHTAHDCTYERECFLAHIFAPCLLKPLLISAVAPLSSSDMAFSFRLLLIILSRLICFFWIKNVNSDKSVITALVRVASVFF